MLIYLIWIRRMMSVHSSYFMRLINWLIVYRCDTRVTHGAPIPGSSITNLSPSLHNTSRITDAARTDASSSPAGVVYAELELFAYRPSALIDSQSHVHGAGEEVEYASIDFLRTAQLPQSSAENLDHVDDKQSDDTHIYNN